MREKEKTLAFNVIFRPEPEGGFTVLVPSLPGCITYGRTIKKAQEMAVEAIALYLETVESRGEKVVSDRHNRISTIQVPIMAHA